MKLLRIFIFFLFIQNLYAQFEGYTPSLTVQTTEVYNNSNIYQKDFLYLCQGLIEFHANVFKNFPEKEFNNQKEIIYKQLAVCNNESDFGDIVNKFTNQIKDGHTGINIKRESGKNFIYPFRCKYLIDTLIIMAVSDQLPFDLCGEKIKSINGIPIDAIEKKAARIYTTENYVSLQNDIMLQINSTEYLKALDIVQSDTASVSVTTYSGKEFVASPNFNGNWKSQVSTKTLVTERQSEPFTYKIVKEKNLCYIQFNLMVDKRIGEKYIEMLPFWKHWLIKTIRFFGGSGGVSKVYFEDFLNTCLEDIEKNNIQKVIVDLRWNTGGSSTLGDILLYGFNVDKYKSFSSERRISELYKLQNGVAESDTSNLKDVDTTDSFSYTKNVNGIEKIKKRFKGNVYFIISEWTFSAAVMLATTVKDNSLFKVIGEPTAEKPSHFGEVLFLRLPNTNTICSLSCKQFYRPDKSRDNDETLYPDVTIYKTYEDIKNGTDRVYEWIVAQ